MTFRCQSTDVFPHLEINGLLGIRKRIWQNGRWSVIPPSPDQNNKNIINILWSNPKSKQLYNYHPKWNIFSLLVYLMLLGGFLNFLKKRKHSKKSECRTLIINAYLNEQYVCPVMNYAMLPVLNNIYPIVNCASSFI